MKNASVLGGLILAAVDTEGRPSLAWWARRAPQVIKHSAADLRRDSRHALRGTTGELVGAAAGLLGH